MAIIFRYHWLIYIIILFSTCSKINYYPDVDYDPVITKFIAHRGGGDCGFQENSINAAKYGLQNFDGIEVDIHLSKDRTIWLSHSVEFEACGGVSYDCFPETYDHEIIELDSCNGDIYNYYRLEEVFKLIADSFPDKYISLDVRAWSPCKITSLDVTGVMKVIAEKIIELAEKYKIVHQVMVESEVAVFLTHLKKHNGNIECYLTTLGDFERGMLIALEADYDGISFKYKYDEEITLDHIHMIRSKGLKIQLWTVNNIDEMEEAISINPDFIQTDNVEYVLSYKMF